MPAKSIIDVEIQTAAFEKFQNLFDKYSENLRKQPEIWKKINAEHQKLASGFASLGNKMDAHFESVESLQDVQESSEKSLMHSESLWGGIEKASGKTAGNVARATGSLLRWTGILSGITGLLGYFSIDGMMRMGQDALGWRKSAMGLGMTTGQDRAFNIVFARLLGNPAGFLGGVSTGLANIASPNYAMLGALGINTNGSTSQVSVELLKTIFARAHATPTALLGPMLEMPYELAGFGISLEDLRAMKRMSPGEFNKDVLGTYATAQTSLNQKDSNLRLWDQFLAGTSVAGGKLENTFMKALVQLASPISKLMNAGTHVIDAMLKNPDTAKQIDSIAKSLNDFSGTISKPHFLERLDHFVKDMDDLLGDFGKVMTGWHSMTSPIPLPDWASPAKEGAKIRTSIADFFKPGYGARYLAGQRNKWMEAANKMDPSGLLATVGWLESRMNPYAPDSSKGAEGIMQIMPEIARAAHIDPRNPQAALWWANQQLGRLSHEYHGDIGKTLAAYNWGEGNLNRDISKYGNEWAAHVPTETLNYILNALRMMQITVNIHGAPPGYTASASISTLGASR